MRTKTGHGIDFTEAGPEQAGPLHRLISELAIYEDMRSVHLCTEECLRKELSSEDRTLRAYLITLDGEIAGMVTWFETFSTFAGARGMYLEDLYIREEFRQRGIGTEAMRYLARVAEGRNYARIEWTSLLWNNIATEFYESLGASPNDSWTTYRLDGEWLQRLASG